MKEKFSCCGSTRLAVAVIALLLLLGLQSAMAGGAGEQDASAPPEKVVLRFPHYMFGIEGPYKQTWTGLVQDYERLNPSVDIDDYAVTYAEHHDKLQTAIAGGNPPDLMQLAPPYFARFLKAGALLPLDDYTDIKAATAGYGPLQTRVVPSFAPDRRTYGLITWANWMVPWYRPSILKAGGFAEFPKTLPEFEKAIASLTKGDVYGYGGAFVPGNWVEGQYELIWWLYALGGDYAVNGVPTLDAPAVVETVSMLNKWYKAGYVPKEIDMSTKRKLMATGKVAIMAGNPGEYSICVGLNPDLPRDDMIAAHWPSEHQEVVTIIQSLAVSATTKFPKEAVAFNVWFHNTENQMKAVLQASMTSARTNVMNDPDFAAKYLAKQPNAKALLDYTDKLKLMVPADFLAKNVDQVIKTWWTYTEKVLYENADPAKAMKDAQQEALSVYE